MLVLKAKDCLQCGRPFMPPVGVDTKHWRERYKVCSLACQRKCHSRRVILKCLNCGQPFSVKQKDRNRRHHCSSRCYSEAKTRTVRGAKNPNWKGGISKRFAASGRGNRLYRKGTARERRCRKTLEASGYYVTRSAGSRGVWDLIAMRYDGGKLIQVKTNSKLLPAERQRICAFVAPPHFQKELWTFYDAMRAPAVEVIP